MISKKNKVIIALAIILALALIAGIYFWPAVTPKEKNNTTETPAKSEQIKINDTVKPNKTTLTWRASSCFMYPSENKNVYDLYADVKNSSAEVEFRITYFNEDKDVVFGTKSSFFNLSPGHAILETMTSPYGAYENLPLDIKVYINKTFSEEKNVNLTCEKESSSSSGTTTSGSISPNLPPGVNPEPRQTPGSPPPTERIPDSTVKPTTNPTTRPTTRPTAKPTPRQTCSVRY